MKVKNHVFIVTGGGSGLGESTVRMLVKEGAKVAIFDMSTVNGEKLQREMGDQTAFFQVNVTDEQSVKAAVQGVVAKWSAIHGVVNCAGVASAIPTVGKNGPYPLDAFELVLKINVTGSFNVARLAAHQMSKQQPSEDGDRGVIINVASVAAYEGQKGQAAYSASKGAIVSMALPMARDLARWNIRVANIAPGVFETPMTKAFPDKVRQALLKDIPSNRFGQSEEFAHAALFIVTNPYVNGTTIRVDGAVRMSNL
eukprot:GDKI01034178.1.p1 GENE.GDKI01034178.1~~GDKI01034178.1.p1  ORF type:complete len:255 (+),score=59.59 GDKI01034178.1:65-829(+)